MSCEFYWEEGVCLDLRRNNTFKARNTNMVSGEITYGRYRKEGSSIILKDPIKFGMAKMNDTLIITGEGLEFKLETPWRVEGGILRCK